MTSENSPITAEMVEQFDFAAVSRALVAFGEMIARLWDGVVGMMSWVLMAKQRYGSYIPGAGRCYGPTPLAIDGAAYRRRLLRRSPL